MNSLNRLALPIFSLFHPIVGVGIETTPITRLPRPWLRPAIGACLTSCGFVGDRRSAQRDLEFIQQHLVIREQGRGRQRLWRRVCLGDWMDNFEPRYPRIDFERSEAVRWFLYRKMQGDPGLWGTVNWARDQSLH